MSRGAIDLAGQVFGRLRALERVGSRNRFALWRCACECGVIVETRSDLLRSGASSSCGCFSRERSTTHGATRNRAISSEYRSWAAMLQRCTNPLNPAWEDYGGRGITVTLRWHVFEAFLSDMGPKPGPGYSIDRVDNALGYELGNCRWATPKEQANNRRAMRPHDRLVGGKRVSIAGEARWYLDREISNLEKHT